MSDLDKLMNKLKTEEKETPEVVETPKVKETPKVEETPEMVDNFDTDDDEDDEDDEDVEDVKDVKDVEDVEDPKVNPIEHEVAVLQNDGVFRRELLFIKKEQVDVLKVMAQLLIDIKKNGKKTKG